MAAFASRTVVVKNPQGLHLRPAELLAKLSQQYPCKVEILHNGERVDAKSIFAIVTLVAMQGTELNFEADGENAEAALEAIAKLFDEQFGEAE
jgi:phosphotransferase system HPr (HPr) family protein